MQLPKAQPNVVDRIVGWVDPVRGAQRMRARIAMAIAGQHLGGRTDRRETAGWLPWAGSADADDLNSLDNLRRRSRDLQRNEPLARGAINTVVTNVVATGLVLRSTIDRETLGMSAEEAEVWQRTAEREFRLWAHNPIACDIRGQLNFYALTELAYRSSLDSGDVFSVLPMVERRGSPYAVKVQLIEADRCCNKGGAFDTLALAGGIARDAYGLPVAYHFLRQHPGSQVLAGSREWDVVPAFGAQTGRRNVVHLHEVLRPEQSRGLPYLSPVVEMLKSLGKYTNAELMAAVVGALFTVFVKTPGGLGIGLDATGTAPTTTPKSGDAVKLGSGSIVDLATGEDIVIADPKRPNQAFDPFVLAVLRQIGVALELPFELLVKHFTSSYTAARAALLQASMFFLKKRAAVGASFCDPIYEAVLEEGVARRRILAPGFFDDPAIRAAYCGAEWIGDAFGLLDPLKEAEAVEKWLQLELTCQTDEAARNFGTEWARTMERRANEQKLREKLGLTAPAASATTENDPKQPEPPASDSDLEKE